MSGPVSSVAHLGLTGTASLADELDSARPTRPPTVLPHARRPGAPTCSPRIAETLMVVLRDGRKIIGVLRSFDQFANIVLEGAIERIIFGMRFADVPLGLYVVRGENVVLLGQIVRRLPSPFTACGARPPTVPVRAHPPPPWRVGSTRPFCGRVLRTTPRRRTPRESC